MEQVAGVGQACLGIENITSEGLVGITMLVFRRICGGGGWVTGLIMLGEKRRKLLGKGGCVCRGCCCIRLRMWSWLLKGFRTVELWKGLGVGRVEPWTCCAITLGLIKADIPYRFTSYGVRGR